jgi:hypothetical protein
MAWKITTPQAGMQPITETGSTQNHPLGTIVTARDETYGGGEFIYLKGIGSTLVGSLVTYDPVRAVTALSPDTAGLTNPYAVAMSANIANQYGWYQIAGVARIQKTTTKFTTAAAKLYQSGTTGKVMSTVASQKAIQQCVSANSATTASAATMILAVINRPSGGGIVI